MLIIHIYVGQLLKEHINNNNNNNVLLIAPLAILYKCGLRLVLKTVNEFESVTHRARRFHTDGYEHRNLRRPKRCVLVLCWIRSPRVAERR